MPQLLMTLMLGWLGPLLQAFNELADTPSAFLEWLRKSAAVPAPALGPALAARQPQSLPPDAQAAAQASAELAQLTSVVTAIRTAAEAAAVGRLPLEVILQSLPPEGIRRMAEDSRQLAVDGIRLPTVNHSYLRQLQLAAEAELVRVQARAAELARAPGGAAAAGARPAGVGAAQGGTASRGMEGTPSPSTSGLTNRTGSLASSLSLGLSGADGVEEEGEEEAEGDLGDAGGCTTPTAAAGGASGGSRAKGKGTTRALLDPGLARELVGLVEEGLAAGEDFDTLHTPKMAALRCLFRFCESTGEQLLVYATR